MRARPWLAALGLLALGACASDGGRSASAAYQPLTPTERYAIQVKPKPQEMQLAVHGGGLSSTQAEALRVFISDWRDANGGDVTLKAPEHGPDRDAAYRTVVDTRDFLVAQGIQLQKIRIVGYDAGGDPKAPVTVGFIRYEAKGPQCGQSWGDLSQDESNEPYHEFGCAVTADIAAQIADPSDLLQARASDPPDAQRRQTVTNMYRQGAITSTPADPQADGTLATVGQ